MLEEQVQNNGRLYFNIAYKILGNAEASEDVCQKAFLKAWDNLETIRNMSTIKSWISKVIVNEAFQIVRRRKIADKVFNKYSGDFAEDDNTNNQIELKPVIREALSQLSEPMRTIVVLRAMQKMPGREVAAALDCSESKVSRLFYEGLEKLREFLSS